MKVQLSPMLWLGGATLVRIGLDFGTWALPAGQGMTEPDSANLMNAVTGVANQPPNRDR